MDDMAPPLDQVTLLGRGPCPLSFEATMRPVLVPFGPCAGARFARAAPSSFHLTQLRYFPCGSPAATALWLFQRGNAIAGVVGTTAGDALVSVSAVTLRVVEALSAFA